MRQAQVYVHGVKAGILTEVDKKKYQFEYDADYLTQTNAPSVCLAMPVSKQRYESDCLFPFFANLLSEGENRNYQERLHRLSSRDDFGLLLCTANYDTIGCVTVKPLI